jgi:hypothetical protein
MQGHDPQAATDRVHAVAGRLDGEYLLQLFELLGVFGGEVVRVGPVLVEVAIHPS